MRISDLLSLGKEYLLLGILLILFLFLCFSFGYLVIYRKLLKGKKQIHPKSLLLPGVFLCYLFVVLGATILSRGEDWWNASFSLHLFSSYREAWNSFSAAEWRNLILNICMFIPFGFLLPLLSKKFQRFWSTYLAGFLFTLILELLQLLFKRGIFEIDDILNNLAGAMIGYGFYRLFRLAVSRIRKEKEKILPVLCLQLPLLVTAGAFIVIFAVYSRKELGNLSCSYNFTHDVSLVTRESYSDQVGEAMIYRFPTLSVSDTEAFAEEFFAGLGVGIDDSRTDIYEETAIYYSDDGNRYSLWIDYAGGTYTYTDFDAIDYETQTETVKTEEQVRADLKELGILPPAECGFSSLGNRQYQFLMARAASGSEMYDGAISCTYGKDDTLSHVNYLLSSYTSYKQAPVISEQEAAEQIADGRFYYYTDEPLSVELGAVSMDYQKDSKGFYQPVYCFEAVVNDQEMQIRIPALAQ